MRQTIHLSTLVGFTIGYALIISQLTEGPHGIMITIRDGYADYMERLAAWLYPVDAKKREKLLTWKNLAYCGYCLAPYMAIPVFFTALKTMKIHINPLLALLGAGMATSIAAIIRHSAEQF